MPTNRISTSNLENSLEAEFQFQKCQVSKSLWCQEDALAHGKINLLNVSCTTAQAFHSAICCLFLAHFQEN